MGTLLPHLGPLKSAVQRLEVRAACHLVLSNVPAAYNDVELAIGLAEKLHGEPFLLPLLVRFACYAQIYPVIAYGIPAWSEAELKKLQHRLLGINFAAEFRHALKSELIAEVDQIDWIKKVGVDYYLAPVSLHSQPPRKTLQRELFLNLIPNGWFDLEKANLYEITYRALLPAFNPTNITFDPHNVETNADKLLENKKVPKIFLDHQMQALTFVPSNLKSLRRAAREQAAVNLAAVAIALELHKRATGAYPVNFQHLVPGFIPKLPHDPINGGELKYRKTDDSYLLYSIGWNNKDDGGQPGKTFEELDLVW